MSGILYGVGVGPGDPELMTLKALRLIQENEVIAIPGEIPRESVAWKIASQACKDMETKTALPIPMPMTKDNAVLEESHDKGAMLIKEQLEMDRNVVFLTLGDPTVYSTYLYVHKRIEAMGYPVEIVSGITSFCAVAARLNIGLVEKAQPLHVIPASYQIEDALELPGTKVLMKAGKKMKNVKEILCKKDMEAVMIENCGMPQEKIYSSREEIPEDAGYYSLIIAKDKEQ